MGYLSEFFLALAGTAVGGAVAALFAYNMTKLSSRAEATISVISDFLDDDFSKRRMELRNDLQRFDALTLCKNLHSDKNISDAKLNIIYVLNREDLILKQVFHGMLDRDMIRNTIWEFIIDDKIVCESFIEELAGHLDKDRPLFPYVRYYQDIWFKSAFSGRY